MSTRSHEVIYEVLRSAARDATAGQVERQLFTALLPYVVSPKYLLQLRVVVEHTALTRTIRVSGVHRALRELEPSSIQVRKHYRTPDEHP